MHPVDAPNTSGRLAMRYAITGRVYDLLDAPWERKYRKWRPQIVGDVSGAVLEAGVGTGRNLSYYPPGAEVTGVDLSPVMLRRAQRRCDTAPCPVRLEQADATRLSHLESNAFDWYIATFMYCLLPRQLQRQAIAEMVRVLRAGGRFRILEMVYSQNPATRRRQERWAPCVYRVYGARFDRDTLALLCDTPGLKVNSTRFLEADTYLLIEGETLP